MIKVSTFKGDLEGVPQVIPLFGKADAVFEKTAAPKLLPDVSAFIESLKPDKESQYVLVSALGAGEYWGANSNSDYFSEASLIHAPSNWTGQAAIDKVTAKDWPYGYPTFYYAHPYMHHRNQDSNRAYGEVVFVTWNPHMHRVELVARVDKDKCQKFSGMSLWEKLEAGKYVDVSMGAKVKYDLCSNCTDWGTYNKALQTFDPKKHRAPDDAVLSFHKALLAKGEKGIQGLAPTRKEYCECCRKNMGKTLPSGKKVFVYNPYPRFFDISFVFVGADKTAKVMMKVASFGGLESMSSAELADHLGYEEDSDSKTASAKTAVQKKGEMDKRVFPSQFAPAAVPVIAGRDPDLPTDLLNDISKKHPLEEILSSTAGMGIVLKPKEFQRVVLIRMNKPGLADTLDRAGATFPLGLPPSEGAPMGPEFFSHGLSSLLAPFFSSRSGLGPAIEGRALFAGESSMSAPSPSLSTSILIKIGGQYSSYRDELMNVVAHAQELLDRAPETGLNKVASISADVMFTPLACNYLRSAYTV